MFSSQILIPFLEDVASPSVDDSVSAVHTEDSTGVKPRSEIQFCRTGKMEMKWPSHLTTVDIPASRPGRAQMVFYELLRTNEAYCELQMRLLTI